MMMMMMMKVTDWLGSSDDEDDDDDDDVDVEKDVLTTRAAFEGSSVHLSPITQPLKCPVTLLNGRSGCTTSMTPSECAQVYRRLYSSLPIIYTIIPN